MSAPTRRADFPEKLQCLFGSSRYKVLHGGRGGAKSWGVARALLILGAQKQLRILCAREIQKSIQDSVHQLLKDQIEALGFSDFYEVLNTEIRGLNGTLIVFAGLKHNVNNIKSKEGLDIVWVEEAQTVSKTSWDTLIPTIRKDNSEIWITFNPELEGDETYKRFVKSPPASAVVQQVNWSDNPWFPEVLRLEKDDLRIRDPDAYLNVWEGHCKAVLDGAIYAKEIRAAMEAKRICSVPYNPIKPVDVFCDIGWADYSSLWFVQKIGFEYHALKAYQNRQNPWNHYLQYIQSQGYVIGTVWLPHDAAAKELGTGKSIEEITRAAGFTVRVVPMLSVEDGINALRTIFPNIYWDTEECADGLNALKRYRYEFDPNDGQYSRRPLHDDASHFADGARYFAVAMRDSGVKRQTVPKAAPGAGAGAWMGR